MWKGTGGGYGETKPVIVYELQHVVETVDVILKQWFQDGQAIWPKGGPTFVPLQVKSMSISYNGSDVAVSFSVFESRNFGSQKFSLINIYTRNP